PLVRFAGSAREGRQARRSAHFPYSHRRGARPDCRARRPDCPADCSARVLRPAPDSACRAFLRSSPGSDTPQLREAPKVQPWTAFRGSFHSPLCPAWKIGAVNKSGTIVLFPGTAVGVYRHGKARRLPRPSQEQAMGIIWTIIIGFVAGVIAKFIMPGSNEPSGFVLTTILGMVGALLWGFGGRGAHWRRRRRHYRSRCLGSDRQAARVGH